MGAGAGQWGQLHNVLNAISTTDPMPCVFHYNFFKKQKDHSSMARGPERPHREPLGLKQGTQATSGDRAGLEAVVACQLPGRTSVGF